MEAQSLIMGVILVALSIFFVLWPLFSVTREDETNALANRRNTLMEQREAIYATIRDLDFDYETGKLAEDIYRSQRNSWVERGVEVLRAVDQLKQQFSEAGLNLDTTSISSNGGTQDVDAQIEAAIAARRRIS